MEQVAEGGPHQLGLSRWVAETKLSPRDQFTVNCLTVWINTPMGALDKGIARDRKQLNRAGMYARLRDLENRIEAYRSELGQR